MESSFLLALFGMGGSGIIIILNYFLKSRCTEVRCCGVLCKRDVLSEEAVLEMDRTRGAASTAQTVTRT